MGSIGPHYGLRSAEVLLPAGSRIAFTSGLDCNDHRAIRDTLNKARAKHPDMLLLHGGSPKGPERIAACCWADSRKVPQIAFKPDWARQAKAAPFTGIQDNLADKAKRLGIPVWRFTGGGA